MDADMDWSAGIATATVATVTKPFPSNTQTRGEPFTSKFGPGTIRLDVQLTQHEDYKSVSQFEGAIFFERTGHEEVEVGHVTAYIIDKEDGSWLDEIMMKTTKNSDDDLALVLRNVYGAEGEVEDPSLARYKSELENHNVCYVHHFQLGRYYRASGLGTAALQAILGTLPELSDGHGFEGMVLLTPFVLDPATCPGKTKKEKHENLCAFYKRGGDFSRLLDGMLVGYQEISRTLMGRWLEKRVEEPPLADDEAARILLSLMEAVTF